MNKIIIVENIDIHVTKKRIKHLYLKVSPPEGKVSLSTPLYISDKEVFEFVLKRKDWIKGQRERMQKKSLNFKKWTIEEKITGKNYLEEKVPYFIKKWEPIIDVEVNSWYLRLMKTRWGSCNINKKRICLNLSLSRTSEDLLGYVIIHEMLHLKERYHNKRFYSYMEKYVPDWKEHKKKLSEG